MVKGDQNIMVILSSPSGVGKTTITKKIQQKYNSFKISVSHTTRSARSNEVEGVDYHFVDEETFKKLIDEETLRNRARTKKQRDLMPIYKKRALYKRRHANLTESELELKRQRDRNYKESLKVT